MPGLFENPESQTVLAQKGSFEINLVLLSTLCRVQGHKGTYVPTYNFCGTKFAAIGNSVAINVKLNIKECLIF